MFARKQPFALTVAAPLNMAMAAAKQRRARAWNTHPMIPEDERRKLFMPTGRKRPSAAKTAERDGARSNTTIRANTAASRKKRFIPKMIPAIACDRGSLSLPETVWHRKPNTRAQTGNASLPESESARETLVSRKPKL